MGVGSWRIQGAAQGGLSNCSLFFFFCFLGPHSQYMEVPRPRVEWEQQLLAYATAAETRDPSCICDVHHSSRQRWILYLLSETRG